MLSINPEWDEFILQQAEIAAKVLGIGSMPEIEYGTWDEPDPAGLKTVGRAISAEHKIVLYVNQINGEYSKARMFVAAVVYHETFHLWMGLMRKIAIAKLPVPELYDRIMAEDAKQKAGGGREIPDGKPVVELYADAFAVWLAQKEFGDKPKFKNAVWAEMVEELLPTMPNILAQNVL